MKIRVNGKSIELPEGSSPKEAAETLHLTAPEQAVAVSINGKLRDFDTALSEGDEVVFLNFDDTEGKEVFWHTSAHVLAQAILRLWPNAQPTIGPPIENGFYYDFGNLTISDQDFDQIEKEVAAILSENFKTKRMEFQNKQEAREAFDKNPFKCELIDSFQEEPISAYKQGEFFDLCRGPHMASLNKIKAFKVLKTSGAYWRGDSNREMLTRIYAVSFPDKKRLKEYLYLLEEAKKRDHKLLGAALDLFSFKEEAPGMPFIHPRGLIIWNRLLDFLRCELNAANYIEIKTPMMMSKELWERSGHWYHYRENMYLSSIEERDFAIKPMNCPGCMLFYRSTIHSYRELPLRVAEIGHVHRFEASGALNGLFRVRSFHQDDAHLFMRPDQIQSEIQHILEFADKIYMTFGLPYRLELSTRPEKAKTIGTDAEWENATNGLKGALDEWGHSYRINEGDGAFYGPKIDIHIRDAIGRHWQCGTVQLDMSLPEKFELEYVDNEGQHKRPVMLHRAIFGSLERLFGILVEHFAGKFPFWLSPYQVKILTIADRHAPFAHEIAQRIRKLGLVCDVDETNESMGKKVRTFIEVLRDREGPSMEVEPGVTSGDFLQGFLLGTRDALSEKDRGSITLTLSEISPKSIGMLIALYERVVGFYGSLVGVNAYHQPGVEAGKKAAGSVIALKLKLSAALKAAPGQAFTAEALAQQTSGDPELAFKILEHLSANGSVKKTPRTPWFESTYQA